MRIEFGGSSDNHPHAKAAHTLGGGGDDGFQKNGTQSLLLP